MEVVRLRTLTLKSKLGFGQYDIIPIGRIIELDKSHYLRWVYYNYDSITFTPEILTQIGIISDKFDNSIPKPGSDKERYKDIKYISPSKEYKKKIKMKYKDFREKDKKDFNRIRLRRKNHGHK